MIFTLLRYDNKTPKVSRLAARFMLPTENKTLKTHLVDVSRVEGQ